MALDKKVAYNLYLDLWKIHSTYIDAEKNGENLSKIESDLKKLHKKYPEFQLAKDYNDSLYAEFMREYKNQQNEQV